MPQMCGACKFFQSKGKADPPILPRPRNISTRVFSLLAKDPTFVCRCQHSIAHRSNEVSYNDVCRSHRLVGDVDVVVDKLRVDGSRVLVAEVEVGDETGSVSLRARDDQIDLLRKVSHDNGAIVLRNAQIELYQGRYLRLAVSKWGKMEAYPG